MGDGGQDRGERGITPLSCGELLPLCSVPMKLLPRDQERWVSALTCSISSCASFTKSTLFVSIKRAAALLSTGEESEALDLEEKPNRFLKITKGNQHCSKEKLSYYTLCLERGLNRLFKFT